MQIILKLALRQLVLFLIVFLGACSTGKNRKVDESALVRVAIVKLINVSKQPLYDYLSESLTDATQNSMDKKFIYYHLPAAKTQDLFMELESKSGVIDNARLRTHALDMDADLIIFGFYTTTPGKKGDTAEILLTIFRADKALQIGNLSRKTTISAAVFKDIDSIANELVEQIVEYRKSQIREQGQKEPVEMAHEKIQLTRKSINILPFIPPIF